MSIVEEKRLIEQCVGGDKPAWPKRQKWNKTDDQADPKVINQLATDIIKQAECAKGGEIRDNFEPHQKIPSVPQRICARHQIHQGKKQQMELGKPTRHPKGLEKSQCILLPIEIHDIIQRVTVNA